MVVVVVLSSCGGRRVVVDATVPVWFVFVVLWAAADVCWRVVFWHCSALSR